jgi:methionyl-tRNA formyltransferase
MLHDTHASQSLTVDSSVRPPLNVGLLVDSLTQPQWVYDIVAAIQQSTCARVALVVKNGDVDQPERRLLRKLTRNRSRLAYALYTRVDDWLFRRAPDAFTEVSIEELVTGVPTLKVVPVKKRFSDFFEPADVSAICAHNLDVALRFGFRILRGDALRIARHGVWSYHHGDNLVNRGGPPGFWEVMHNEPVTGSVLQILSDELDNGKVIYRSHALTDPRSVRRNQNNFYRKSAAFVMRKLTDLHTCGPSALECDEHADNYVPYTRPLYREPGNLDTLRLTARLASRYAVDKLTEIVWREQWSLGYRLHPGAAGPDPAFHRYKLLAPPADRFWADPFPVAVDDGFLIFVEELPFRTNKGHISVLDLAPNGQLRRVEPVLERPHHLSYPFVFEWRGDHYMIPETGAARRVELYRATDFPRGWTPEHVLLDGVYAVDATLAEIDGRWWMFANIARDGVRNYDELHVFHAPAPHGPWRPHRRNPVKSDARCARPAGRLFWWNGDLYRPSQDCSGQYGAAIVVNKVLQLTTSDYRETAVSRIEPKWAPHLLGAHTLNSAPGISVVDVLVRRSRFARSPRPAAEAVAT